jgi:hypothetical protein
VISGSGGWRSLTSGERAIAAAERGVEAAAATRAEVTYTPTENSAKGNPRTRRYDLARSLS